MRLLSNLEGVSACLCAEFLGVDLHWVLNHINTGTLKAEVIRRDREGKANYYIREEDLRRFIINNPALVDLRKVEKKVEVKVEAEAHDIPTLFVEWLNKLLTRADIKKMVFRDFKVTSIEPFGYDLYKLKGAAFGEKLDPRRHMIKTEAKAATYFGLKYEFNDGNHYLQCVIDV